VENNFINIIKLAFFDNTHPVDARQTKRDYGARSSRPVFQVKYTIPG